MTDAMRFETAAIHAGQDPDSATGSAIVPIYQTSTYIQQAVGVHKGYEYSRTDNPTRTALETCIAALESVPFGLAFASGMAATTTLAMTLEAGDRILVPDDVYGGTYRLFSKVTAPLGLEFATVDMTNLEAVEKSLERGAKMLLAETPSNPLLKIVDLEALGALVKGAGAMFVVDNTFATPYIQRPIEFGADAVIYSATKYLGGHSDLVVGLITTPHEELYERLKFLQNAVGAICGPFDAWLLLRGLKTLGIRMRAHCAGAWKVAEWLRDQPQLHDVHYPGFADFAHHDFARKQMSVAGEPLYGGMVTFEAESQARAIEICEKTELFWLGESLGGVESLIEHPGTMTHASLAGSDIEVHDSLVRLSVGIEHPDDLIEDLARALG
jgi:cystathionine gamma-synthase